MIFATSQREHHVRGISAAMVLAGCLSLAACSGAPAHKDVAPETLRAAMALTDFPPEINIAQSLLVQECVRSSGFDMPFDSSSARSKPLTTGISNVFGSIDEARRIGYDSTVSDDNDVLGKWEQSLSDGERLEYYDVLQGPEDGKRVSVTLSGGGGEMSMPATGCLAQARAELYGSVENEAAFEALVNEYLAAAVNNGNSRDARLAPLVPTFEQCMKDRGYTVHALGAADLAKEMFGAYRSATESPSEAEQKLAEADFLCQQKINLQGVLTDSFAQGAADWLHANEGKLLAMTEELKEVKDRAVKVING